MPAAHTRPAPTAPRAAVANEGQRRGKADVVELVNRREFAHEQRFAAAY